MLIINALSNFARESQRQFESDRSQTVGASEVGGCARKAYFVKNEPDHVHKVERDEDYEEDTGFTQRGQIYEDNVYTPAMRQAFKDRFLYGGSEQRTFIKGFLSATPDGLIIDLTDEEKESLGITDDSTCVSVDCKTLDPRVTLTEAKPENVFQIQVQVGLIRELTNHKPTHGILSYTNASQFSQIQQFVIPFDHDVYRVAHDRARQIMTATSPDQIRAEGILAGRRECKYCPFTKQCGLTQYGDVPFKDYPISSDAKQQIEKIAYQIKLLDKEAKRIDNQLGQLKFDLKETLKRVGTRKVPGIVSWSAIKGRTGWDNDGIRKAAIEAGIDIDQFRTVGDPSDRLTISLKIEGDESEAGNQNVE